ncbi:hypothetical protein HDE_12452 [Halotydeus destructor]|nr:hypothetical protein HDE_12452 [Halotydeus destructor]
MSRNLLIAFLGLAALCQLLEGQQVNSYKVTIFFGTTGSFEKNVDGKLKITFIGRAGQHKMALSAQAETFSKGMVKEYYVAAPFFAENIDKVSLEFTYKKELTSPWGWIKSPNVYIDRVTVTPAYMTDANARLAQTKGFCGAPRPQKLKAKEEAEFWIRC